MNALSKQEILEDLELLKRQTEQAIFYVTHLPLIEDDKAHAPEGYDFKIGDFLVKRINRQPLPENVLLKCPQSHLDQVPR